MALLLSGVRYLAHTPNFSAGSTSNGQVHTRIFEVRQGGRLPPGVGLPGPFWNLMISMDLRSRVAHPAPVGRLWFSPGHAAGTCALREYLHL